MTIDTKNMCSHLQRKLFDAEGEYRAIREQIETDPTLTAVIPIEQSSAGGAVCGRRKERRT